MTTASRYFDTFSGVYLPEQPSSPPEYRAEPEENSERLADWDACPDGTAWFASRYPGGGEYPDVMRALRAAIARVECQK